MLRKSLCASLTLFLMSNLSFGECAWEELLTDQSGDGKSTSSVFTLPCETQAIYVYYKIPDDGQFHVEIEDVGNGMLLAAQSMKCGCTNVIAFKKIGGLPEGSVLRFRATSESCEGVGTASGQATAVFYTSSTFNPSSKCEGEK